MVTSAAALPRVYPTVVHMLIQAAVDASGADALVCGDRRLTYQDYVTCVGGFAADLIDLGAEGERVATILPNSIEACIATFSIWSAGAQAVPLDPSSTAKGLEDALKEVAPQVLIVDASVEATVRPLVQTATSPHMVVLGEGARRLDSWLGLWLTPEPPDPGDLALLQYLGGNALGRGVNLTHNVLSANVAQHESVLRTEEGEQIACALPLSHPDGMATGLLRAVYCRGPLVMPCDRE